MAKPAPRHTTSRRPQVLPLFLYDLTSASWLFPPDVVLPEQFHGSPTTTSLAPGETALLRAILVDALECFQKPFRRRTPHARLLAKEAEQWFFADDYHWPFSFVNICTVLGLDVAYVRRRLWEWRQSLWAGD